ncbi:hypothetical protein AB0A77_17510 [Streptomyces varsoviensis]|uniref:hypothetical protein n=1 Tax=Streptomyces varsoviensis TaxID=67373 RepID=UPI0033EB93B1
MQRAWETGRLALIYSTAWTVVEAPLLPSLDVMQQLGPAGKLGPLVGCSEDDLAWWLVSSDDAHDFTGLPELTVKAPGSGLLCLAPAASARAGAG